MSKPIIIFRGATGINNKIDPTRLRFDPETGVTDLAFGVNVDVDDTGRIMRRDGYIFLGPGAYGNLFPMGWYAIATRDGYIGTLSADYIFTPEAIVTPGCRVSYAVLGAQVFYMTGTEKGILNNGAYSAWTAGGYVGPDTNRTFEDPPLGHMIALYNGHMWIAQSSGNVHLLHYSHRFAYSWFDPASNYLMFPDWIRMLMPVSDGLYVGSGTKVYFLQGAIPREMAIQEVADSSVYEGSAFKCPAYKLGLEMSGNGVLWGSPQGIWFSAAGGFTINLTERNLVLPAGNRAVGFYSGEKYYCMVEQ